MARAAERRSIVMLDARVRSDPRQLASAFGSDLWLVVVSIRLAEIDGHAWPTSCRVEVAASESDAERVSSLPVGSEVRITGRAALPRQRSQGICARVWITASPLVIAEPGPVDAVINRMRGGLRESMRWSARDQAGLVPSLVVGDTADIPTDLVDDFKDSSLTHLTAVSGTNLTLMLVFFVAAARAAGVRGWWLRALAIIVVAFFVTICRAEASVVRAAAMGLVALAATGRRGIGAAGLRQLAVAVWLVILIDPWMARSWGFALSAAATAGILWWAGPWQTRMRRWAPGWLAESLCVPAAAQLATQPLITALSGQISVVGLAANMAAAPFVGPVTVLGLLAALVSPLAGTLTAALGWLAGNFVQPIITIAHVAASAPMATLAWPPSAAGIVLLTVFCLLTAMILGRMLGYRSGCIAVSVVMIVACLGRPPSPGWLRDWQLISCDVGQGDATLVRVGAREAIVVDVGPDAESMAQCIRRAAVRTVPLLVLSHFHADHIGGLSGLMDNARVEVALVNPFLSPGSAAEQVRRQLSQAGIRVELAAAGQQWRIGDVSWRTIQAGQPGQAVGTDGQSLMAQDSIRTSSLSSESEENDSSILGRVSGGGPSILLTGDLEPAGQLRAISSSADELRSDVLKLPHHGSARQSEDFLAVTGARVALVSAGKNNRYGHPSAKALTLAARHHMAIVRTDERGSIAVKRRENDALDIVSVR